MGKRIYQVEKRVPKSIRGTKIDTWECNNLVQPGCMGKNDLSGKNMCNRLKVALKVTKNIILFGYIKVKNY